MDGEGLDARASDALPERDLEFARSILPRLRGALHAYFDSSVDGLERVPSGPALLVGNHSGGSSPVESVVFVVEYLEHFGLQRPLYWLGHELLLRLPVVGPFVQRCGVIPADRDAAVATLRAGGHVVVYPGGELDLHRPWTARHEIRFEGRSGFVALARDAGVPIVPVVSSGGQSTYLPLTDGRGLARRLGLDRVVRLKVLPVALALPWGVSIGPLPHVPLPARVRVRVLDPIDVSGISDEEIPTAYSDIVAIMQKGLDELAAT